MDTNKFAGMTAGIVVMLLLASAVLVPTIDGARMTTTTVSNEGAGWAKFAYYEDAEDYSVALSSDGTTLTMGSQSGTADDMIVWASDSAAVIHDGGSFTLLYGDGDSSAAADLGSSATIASVSGALTITDSSSAEVYTSDAVEWSYTPNAGGAFGFFTDSGATVNDFPVATAGTFAGAYAYNGINSLNLSTLTPTYSVTDGIMSMGVWSIPTLGAKTVKILDEKQIKEILSVEEKQLSNLDSTTLIKATAPAYTDGDWQFDISNGNAQIKRYTGAAGDIVIPSTVTANGTTYPVTELQPYNNTEAIFDNAAITGSTVTFPDTLVKFGPYVLKDCTGITGSLIIPDSVTEIGFNSFYHTGFTGDVIIPEGVTTVRNNAFFNTGGLTGALVIPSTVTGIASSSFDTMSVQKVVIGTNAEFLNGNFAGTDDIESLIITGSPTFGDSLFSASTGISEVLNLGNTAISAGSNGIPDTAEVRDDIPAMGYIAPVSFSETTAREGAIYDLMGVIPLLIIASILLAVTSMIIVRRE